MHACAQGAAFFPLSCVETFLFTIIVYFMCGFYYNAGRGGRPWARGGRGGGQVCVQGHMAGVQVCGFYYNVGGGAGARGGRLGVRVCAGAHGGSAGVHGPVAGWGVR